MVTRAFGTLLRERLQHGRLGQLRAVASRVREVVPLTLRGAAVAGVSAGALWFYGFNALDGVWYVAGLGLLALCVIALVSVVAATIRMKLFLVRTPPTSAIKLSTETGRALATGFSVPSLRFWLLVDVRLGVREPAHAEVELQRDGPLVHERLLLRDHGEVRRVARTVRVRDVFGLCSVSLRLTTPAEIDVLPHAGALRSLPLLRSLSGGDDIPHPLGVEQGDRLELRRYAPGDPARFIHWKAYARTQKLVVRMPERALSRAQRVAAYLVAGPADAASAAAARVALEEGAFGADFRFGADGSPTPTRDVQAALVALRRSSGARADGAVQLARFVEELDREGPSSLVLFVPAERGPWVERIGTLLARRSRSARIVIGVDGITQRVGPSWLERLTLFATPTTRVQLTLLRGLITQYRRQGCEVVVVDRESGRVLGDAQLAQPRAPRRSEAA